MRGSVSGPGSSRRSRPTGSPRTWRQTAWKNSRSSSGRSPGALHRFLAAYVRYTVPVRAFLSLVGNPFPGFLGREGSYPVDAVVAPPEEQRRVVTGFRAILAIPAFAISGALSGILSTVAFLGWFAALATGRMPAGLRASGAYALRYGAQVNGYWLLLTEVYPYSGPPGSPTEPAGPPEPAGAPEPRPPAPSEPPPAAPPEPPPTA